MPCTDKHYKSQEHAVQAADAKYAGRGIVRLCECGKGYAIKYNRSNVFMLTEPIEELQHSCFEQKRYPTEQLARGAIRHKGGGKGVVIECSACGGWHIQQASR